MQVIQTHLYISYYIVMPLTLAIIFIGRSIKSIDAICVHSSSVERSVGISAPGYGPI